MRDNDVIQLLIVKHRIERRVNIAHVTQCYQYMHHQVLLNAQQLLLDFKQVCSWSTLKEVSFFNEIILKVLVTDGIIQLV